MSIKQITVIGVGLIGGSFAKGLKSRKFAGKLTGYGANLEKLQRAVEINVIDDFSLDIQDAVKDADLIMLAIPMGAFAEVFKKIQPFIKTSVIITDAGSSKLSVINTAQAIFGKDFTGFVPAHPIAGKEQSGVNVADENLFIDHKVILTPSEKTDKHALKQVKELWKMLGANIVEMSAKEHDDVLAASSHLPHMLAFAMVDLLAGNKDLPKVFDFTAGGFKDFSRIASSNPVMWRDIAISNSPAIIKWLKNYQQSLSKIIQMMENQQADSLLDLFTNAKKTRDEFVAGKNNDN